MLDGKRKDETIRRKVWEEKELVRDCRRRDQPRRTAHLIFREERVDYVRIRKSPETGGGGLACAS